MGTIKCLALFMALNFALPGFSNSAAAGESKNGEALSRNKKGSAKNNAQWSADPERGWVRADERRKSSDSDRAMRTNQNKDKTKGKSKTTKS